MKEVFPPNRNYFEAKPSKGDTGLVVKDAADRELEKIEKNSFVDSLTGCFNRNYFEKFIKEGFDANRDNNKLAFVYIDLNDLKDTNDTYGHAAGDELLKDTAKFLKDNFRKDDTVVRIGGDEFIVICHNHNGYNDFQNILSEQLEESKSKQLEECQSDKPSIDFAFGVAIYNTETDLSDLEKTMKRADQIMYKRKLGTKGIEK